MINRTDIELNTNWRYRPGDDDDFSLRKLDDGDWPLLDSLEDWSDIAPHDDDDPVTWLRRTVKLSPLGYCVVYFLDIREVPLHTEIYVNGKLAGAHKPNSGRFAVDVTRFVSLGTNVIALRLQRGGKVRGEPGFGAIRLQAIPCDEI